MPLSSFNYYGGEDMKVQERPNEPSWSTFQKRERVIAISNNSDTNVYESSYCYFTKLTDDEL